MHSPWRNGRQHFLSRRPLKRRPSRTVASCEIPGASLIAGDPCHWSCPRALGQLTGAARTDLHREALG